MGGTFPTSPDEALGVPEGTLKRIAKSRVGGSQYFTSFNDPGWTLEGKTYVSPPLKGVTFIEVPPGTMWRKIKLNKQCEGILVFHSNAMDAYWNDISVQGDSPFKGLMIFDKLFHIHMDVLGGLVLLSPNLETASECMGNQDHKVFFSRKAIESAAQMVGGGEFEIISYWE